MSLNVKTLLYLSNIVLNPMMYIYSIKDTNITPLFTVCNLGTTFDQTLNFHSDIKLMSCKAFEVLHFVKRI